MLDDLGAFVLIFSTNSFEELHLKLFISMHFENIKILTIMGTKPLQTLLENIVLEN